MQKKRRSPMRTFVRNSDPYRYYTLFREYIQWSKRKFAAPSPHFIKQSCLIRNSVPQATWVETGTHLGQTTQVLARYASRVYSIEPEPTLFANAQRYFEKYEHVDIINGTSEDVFPTLLPTIKGNINFWLDGHYSAGATFQGKQDTPILDELKSIGENIGNFDKICVLVDDIRCFCSSQERYDNYPSIDKLVEWARSNSLSWHIEHDIFVAKN